MDDPMNDEDRVMDFIASCPEGASYFTVTTELGMIRTRAVSILEKLHREGKLSFDCKTKMYFPLAEGRGSRPAELNKGPERVTSLQCRYCGIGKDNLQKLRSHEVHCASNPDRLLTPNARAKQEREAAQVSEPASDQVSSPILGTSKEASSIKMEEVDPDPRLDPYNEPGAFEMSKEGMEDRPHREALKVIEGFTAEGGIVASPSPEAPVIKVWDGPVQFTVNISDDPNKAAQDLVNACRKPIVPADPLALFAHRHRVRVGREISKLRKVEKKLRRRAASAWTMADRVLAARRTKERELRRFEKELGEVSP